MIEFQIYKGKKMVAHRSNLYWTDAFNLLEEKRKLDFDSIDLQLYTDDYATRVMPIDHIDKVESIDDAQHWINQVYRNIILKKYKGLKYGKS